jgi:hypothetical protein
MYDLYFLFCLKLVKTFDQFSYDHELLQQYVVELHIFFKAATQCYSRLQTLCKYMAYLYSSHF